MSKAMINKQRVPMRSVAAKSFKKNWVLYLLLIPAVVQVLIFNYLPLPGLAISFMDYDYMAGFNSPLVGFKHYLEIFSLHDFSQAIYNTLKVSVLYILICFPIPIVFSLMLNEIKDGLFKRFVQTISYLPHFLSWISVIGIAVGIYSSYGLINDLRVWLFGPETERILFLSVRNFFVPNVIMLTIWKEMGWSSIIYLASISGIDKALYEAAAIDGANKFKQCIYVTIPSIMPTIVLLFILAIGNLFSSNFDLIYGLQNVFVNFEVISTAVYKFGITRGKYDVATALGFMQGLISLILVLTGNWISKKNNKISII